MFVNAVVIVGAALLVFSLLAPSAAYASACTAFCASDEASCATLKVTCSRVEGREGKRCRGFGFTGYGLACVC